MMDIEKRFNRILALFLQLQSRPIVRAQDLADRFEVSIRTIYRDIKALEKAGVPIYSEPGTGYSLAHGYKLPPTLFTQDEAMSFVVAEKLAMQYLDTNMALHFSNALSKMRAVLRTEQKVQVNTLSAKVFMKNAKQVFNQSVPNAIALLLEAITAQKQVQLAYQKAGEEEIVKRLIEPVGVFQQHEFWYFMAYCYLRKDVRQFRLDRVQAIKLRDEPMQQKLLSLDYYLKAPNEKEAELQIVHIWVDKMMYRFMDWEKKNYGFIEEQKTQDGFIMQFYYNPQYNALQRWLCMYADGIKILQPLSFQQEMLQLLAAFQKYLQTQN